MKFHPVQKNKLLTATLLLASFGFSIVLSPVAAVASNSQAAPCPVRKTASLGSASDSSDRAVTYLRNGGNKLMTAMCRAQHYTFRPLIISVEYSVADINGRYEGTGNYDFLCVRRKGNTVPSLTPTAACPGGSQP